MHRGRKEFQKDVGDAFECTANHIRLQHKGHTREIRKACGEKRTYRRLLRTIIDSLGLV